MSSSCNFLNNNKVKHKLVSFLETFLNVHFCDENLNFLNIMFDVLKPDA